MSNTLSLYQERLNLKGAIFSRIDHDDAMVAIVYRITPSTGTPLILKICTRPNDYLREVYFLSHFAESLPVPRIVQVVPPETGVDGAILMECLPGDLLRDVDFTEEVAYEMGSLVGRIHLNRASGYGDLIQNALYVEAVTPFTEKFDEGFAECSQHLPDLLLDQCRRYYDTHSGLLTKVDGPCIIHRDFRPGNILFHNGKIQGIIDWSSGRAGFAEEDFCSLEHGECPIPFKNHFLSGYKAIRPLPDYPSLMPLLRLNKAIATIGFLVKTGKWNTSHTYLYKLNRHFIETLSNS